MRYSQGRFSGLLKPLSHFIDITGFIGLTFILSPQLDSFLLKCYLLVSWFVLSYKNGFYQVERFAKLTKIMSLLFRQFVVFFLILFAFIGFFKEHSLSRLLLVQYLIISFLWITIFKFLMFFLLHRYRVLLGGNIRKTVVVGNNVKAKQLIHIFENRPQFGYDFKKSFVPKSKTFSVQECLKYIQNEQVDEIYCSVAELSNEQLGQIVDFADNNLKTVKFIPDNKFIYNKHLRFDYYDFLPILSLREIPLEVSLNAFLKRSFDILFSFLVVVGVLSWLTPLLALLIKWESRGPVFFKQIRHGINGEEFYCFKFRSMAVNKDADKAQATKGDMRVTQIGNFMRKTSIDELPQFINVLFGQMSIVGPRPHMAYHTEIYGNSVDKYMVRHFVKPGITGLAQVRGYRGEILESRDIVNRVRFDIFYVENWSMALDLKIVFDTVYNVVKGEEMAY
ncbi:exopolysaccharide biosynthesis polyprenyl glycosylphosphotransferase [Robertkochia marina]|uniref:Exopolysaccharide biosynthesis polyprenyl glycosylphosphotransferase n=1 Tax=Robertkochia marina TaxID=1227945 RepID=A0A4S3M017_9FLAO|nr:exopolysaccharide biosynthesis polyprenyl glycosylphosphotransferase [Robertkochia marina]THD67732.1 exopolysaccharide biosynthesis polyprenyl glycosylphosphotransferase [Robertkochia marina]TRZ40947.1 exopolysaccharide biosynthesis polyprenyl glycosylphosphotransferase [Robertkochia marina]